MCDVSALVRKKFRNIYIVLHIIIFQIWYVYLVVFKIFYIFRRTATSNEEMYCVTYEWVEIDNFLHLHFDPWILWR